jgi:hypothetical protein
MNSRMQLHFESWSKLKLKLKVENFMKEYVSLIWLLSTIFTAAVERIQTSSCASYCAAATEIQITFGPD